MKEEDENHLELVANTQEDLFPKKEEDLAARPDQHFVLKSSSQVSIQEDEATASRPGGFAALKELILLEAAELVRDRRRGSSDFVDLLKMKNSTDCDSMASRSSKRAVLFRRGEGSWQSRAVGCGSNQTPTTIDDVLAYIKAVEDVIGNNSELYLAFLNIVRDSMAGRIDPAGVATEVAARLEELFEAYPNLLLEFNKFLPKDFEFILLEYGEDHYMEKIKGTAGMADPGTVVNFTDLIALFRRLDEKIEYISKDFGVQDCRMIEAFKELKNCQERLKVIGEKLGTMFLHRMKKDDKNHLKIFVNAHEDLIVLKVLHEWFTKKEEDLEARLDLLSSLSPRDPKGKLKEEGPSKSSSQLLRTKNTGTELETIQEEEITASLPGGLGAGSAGIGIEDLGNTDPAARAKELIILEAAELVRGLKYPLGRLSDGVNLSVSSSDVEQKSIDNILAWSLELGVEIFLVHTMCSRYHTSRSPPSLIPMPGYPSIRTMGPRLGSPPWIHTSGHRMASESARFPASALFAMCHFDGRFNLSPIEPEAFMVVFFHSVAGFGMYSVPFLNLDEIPDRGSGYVPVRFICTVGDMRPRAISQCYAGLIALDFWDFARVVNPLTVEVCQFDAPAYALEVNERCDSMVMFLFDPRAQQWKLLWLRFYVAAQFVFDKYIYTLGDGRGWRRLEGQLFGCPVPRSPSPPCVDGIVVFITAYGPSRTVIIFDASTELLREVDISPVPGVAVQWGPHGFALVDQGSVFPNGAAVNVNEEVFVRMWVRGDDDLRPLGQGPPLQLVEHRDVLWLVEEYPDSDGEGYIGIECTLPSRGGLVLFKRNTSHVFLWNVHSEKRLLLGVPDHFYNVPGNFLQLREITDPTAAAIPR